MQYAAFYEHAYGEDVPLPKLLVSMVQNFMEGDTAFKKWARSQDNA